MSELEKLWARLSGAKNFNVFWGPKAHELSAEERAAIINRSMDETTLNDELPIARFTFVFEENPSGQWIGRSPDLSALLVAGDTLEEAMQAATDKIELWQSGA